MMEQIRGEAERKMQKSVESMRHDLAGVRSGKATPSLLDSVKVRRVEAPAGV